MIDPTIVSVVPAAIAAVGAWFISNKKSRIQYARLLSEMQSKAIEQIRLAEEKMRSEIWKELEKVREENNSLKTEMITLRSQFEDQKKQIVASENLCAVLSRQVTSLESLVETYKQRIIELEKVKE